jgi:hypothetical protein
MERLGGSKGERARLRDTGEDAKGGKSSNRSDGLGSRPGQPFYNRESGIRTAADGKVLEIKPTSRGWRYLQVELNIFSRIERV